jgi:predicted dithiol-disulfide oxidoreductase (DUF899 family)
MMVTRFASSSNQRRSSWPHSSFRTNPPTIAALATRWHRRSWRSSFRSIALRRALPLGGALKEDYVFDELGKNGRARKVKLSELFEDGKNSLFLYSFMYGPKMKEACPMCSSFLDGLNGNAAHIAQRINLAVIARSPIQRIAKFARQRGWNNLRLLSSARNTYNADYFGEDANGEQDTMANVFVRRDGKIYHFWGTEKQPAYPDGDPCHMDTMWPLWNVLDTTPEGRGDWYPPLDLPARTGPRRSTPRAKRASANPKRRARRG